MRISPQTEFAVCGNIPRSESLRRRKMGVGFTLVEVLVSIAILGMIMVAMGSSLDMIRNISKNVSGKLDSFESARTAFDTLARSVRQATLLSYVGYDNSDSPTTYLLKSDLHFVCGTQTDLKLQDTGAASSSAIFFQAPTGVADSASLQNNNSLLNATGFFLDYGDDHLRPSFFDTLSTKPPHRYRFRLFQYLQPRDYMTVYQYTISLSGSIPQPNDNYSGVDWFKSDVDGKRYCHVLAENVIAFVILPVSGGKPADNYLWNSRDPGTNYSHHRLPQSLKIAMAAIDEQSAIRAGFGSRTPPALVPDGLFTDTSEFDQDVKKLDDSLAKHSPKLNYRIFTTEIPLSDTSSNMK